MRMIDNTSVLLGDDLKQNLGKGSRLKIAAACFSIYAFEALRKELEQIEELQFIFTAPTFLPEEVTDKIRKERREFFIPGTSREKSLYGSEFEIQLPQDAVCARLLTVAQPSSCLTPILTL